MSATLGEICNNKIKMPNYITLIQITDIKAFNHSQATLKIYQAQSVRLRQEDQGLQVIHRANS